MITLGNKVRDKVTGMEGIAVSRVEYLNGCVQYAVQPPYKKGLAEMPSWNIDEEKTITCGKFEGGVVEYGILRETGLKDSKVKIMCEGKTVEISRESAKALNLIK